MRGIHKVLWGNERHVAEPLISIRLADAAEKGRVRLEYAIEKWSAGISEQPIVLDLHITPQLQGGRRQQESGPYDADDPAMALELVDAQ